MHLLRIYVIRAMDYRDTKESSMGKMKKGLDWISFLTKLRKTRTSKAYITIAIRLRYDYDTSTTKN